MKTYISLLEELVAMTENWEIRTKKDGGGYDYTVIKDPKQIIPHIKEGLKKGDVTVNGRPVKIVERDGKDAWEYILSHF